MKYIGPNLRNALAALAVAAAFLVYLAIAGDVFSRMFPGEVLK